MLNPLQLVHMIFPGGITDEQCMHAVKPGMRSALALIGIEPPPFLFDMRYFLSVVGVAVCRVSTSTRLPGHTCAHCTESPRFFAAFSASSSA